MRQQGNSTSSHLDWSSKGRLLKQIEAEGTEVSEASSSCLQGTHVLAIISLVPKMLLCLVPGWRARSHTKCHCARDLAKKRTEAQRSETALEKRVRTDSDRSLIRVSRPLSGDCLQSSRIINPISELSTSRVTVLAIHNPFEDQALSGPFFRQRSSRVSRKLSIALCQVVELAPAKTASARSVLGILGVWKKDA